MNTWFKDSCIEATWARKAGSTGAGVGAGAGADTGVDIETGFTAWLVSPSGLDPAVDMFANCGEGIPEPDPIPPTFVLFLFFLPFAIAA